MNTIQKIAAYCALFALLFSIVTPIVGAVGIDANNKYAWSSNAGWINFNPTNGNVDVTDTAITGQAWSDNYGWINLQPTTSGVVNTITNDVNL